METLAPAEPKPSRQVPHHIHTSNQQTLNQKYKHNKGDKTKMIEDGIHKVEKTKPVMSVDGRIVAYIKGASFFVDQGDIKEGDKVVIEDGKVHARIEPLPEAEEAE